MINLIETFKINNPAHNNSNNLNYWLANAFFKMGNYIAAKNVILQNLNEKSDDRFYFLLAMTYEANNEKKMAKKEFNNFLKLFSQSEYLNSAKIKSKILNKY